MIKQWLSHRYIEGAHSAKAVYGIILITASLLGFQLHPESAFHIALMVFLAGMVIVLAEVYADFVGERIQLHKELNRVTRYKVLDDSWVIGSVALYPSIVFILSGFGLWTVDRAYSICFALGLAALAGFGYVSWRAAGESKRSSLLKAIVMTGIGATVIIIKYTFGH